MTKSPLILLPGLLCDAALWEHQSRYLTEVADVSVADLTGHDGIEALADSVLASAPPRFALAGLSMGGYVALEILRRAPDRVIKLALLDTNARADTDEQRRRRRGLMALANQGEFRGVTPRLLPMLIHPSRTDEAELTGVVMEMAERVGKDAFLRQQTAIMNRPDGLPDLGAIACPTLVLCGRQDALSTLEMHVEMADAIPGARLAVVEECGHFVTLERPFAATALMRDWLIYA
ncbi:alpha/beta hydrolase [Skermanella stibiiresistens SB22]|uniref:Alpha/beta hydrolase n=1 Tax=Skermanella stibiiresistens SB22 TaxID=1385369 RepID=W9H0P5_9PROT|nr:alpha/beta fold hydrolase [Skermanella stibiiresistens]EWY39609.1 alpha/beta hydrolase [Skermanella stibiiresistens SB22]